MPTTKARQRAIWVVEDLKWISLKVFQPHVEYSGVVDTVTQKELPLVEYGFGETPFSINNAANTRDKKSTSIGGTMLDRGNLQFLSIVSEIGHRFLADTWLKDEDLKHYLSDPHKHLAALNEIWWLGRFPTAVEITSRHKMHSGSQDIDWRFRLEGTDTWINLEIKNRPKDASRHAHGIQLGANKWLKGVVDKFAQSSSNELNVVALTLFGPIDRHVQDQVSQWLVKHPVIDAILIWSHEGRNQSAFDKQIGTPKAELLKAGLILEPLEELNIVTRNQMVLDRKYWTKEMLESFPPDL